ncbi:urease accessory protein UreD [Actinospongicola halichondriae]|uniref:urease accessory protein UreD n=1 Tax=Actinospongicola halichondriae TaxID=3236844 RepID=UPI003D503C98
MTDPSTPLGLAAARGAVAVASGWTDTQVSIRLRRGTGGTVRVEGVLCSAPVWFRWDGSTLWLVGSGASPVGEDHIRVAVDVGPGVTIAMRSVAASVVYAARGIGTRWDTDIRVAAGARLDWRPEPVILTAHARHTTTTTVHAQRGAHVVVDEVVVLGRTGETTGAFRSTLDVRLDDAPVLLTSVDSAIPGWSGPAGAGGKDVVASRLHIGDAPACPTGGRRDVAVLEPSDECRLAVATATDVADVRRSMDEVLPG